MILFLVFFMLVRINDVVEVNFKEICKLFLLFFFFWRGGDYFFDVCVLLKFDFLGYIGIYFSIYVYSN